MQPSQNTILPSFDEFSKIERSGPPTRGGPRGALIPGLVCACLVTQSARLFETPWTAAHQAPLSMRFPRQEHWSGWPFPPPGDLPNPGMEPGSPASRVHSLPSEPPGGSEWSGANPGLCSWCVVVRSSPPGCDTKVHVHDLASIFHSLA